jgi:pyrroloquinoline quinone (PQQ) biosynthesis protein C
VRAWVINRWMYQSRIPMKDAAFMSRVEDPGPAPRLAQADRGS